MKSFKCPYCYQEHTVENCKITCSQPVCKYNRKDQLGYISKDNYKLCSKKCRNAALQIFCPDENIMDEYFTFIGNHQVDKDVRMKLDIPSEFRENSYKTVAILGGVSAGKTSYLTVLINELNNKFSQAFDCSFKILNTYTQEFYQSYLYKSVYIDNVANEKTDQERIPPLMFSLDFDKNPPFKRKVNLAFYDTAGEDLRGSDTIIEDKGYIANADFLIVLIDPLQMPMVRKKLADKVILPDITESHSAIIDRIIKTFRTVKRIKGKINVPIAVAFSKMDILIENGIFSDDNQPIASESEHIHKNAFVESEYKNTQNIMKAIFANYAEGNPYNKLRADFKNFGLFGFSSLGSSPIGGIKLDEEHKSYRVLDPLIWFLAQEGYIAKIE